MDSKRNEFCPRCNNPVLYDIDKDYLCEGCDQYFCQHCFQTSFTRTPHSDVDTDTEDLLDEEVYSYCKDCSEQTQ